MLHSIGAMLRGAAHWDMHMRHRIEGGGGGGDGGSASGGGGGGGGGAPSAASDAEPVSLRHATPFVEMARAAHNLQRFWAHAAVSRALRAHASASSAAATAAGGVTEGAEQDAEGSEAGVNKSGVNRSGSEAGKSGAIGVLVDSTYFVLRTSISRAAYTYAWRTP